MTIYEQLVALENEGVPFVLVTLVDALGSTPQDAAAKMLVTAKGLHSGTVGGGKVEAAALSLASELLAKADGKPRFVSWTLKGDVGMTCGGAVKFYFEPHSARVTGPSRSSGRATSPRRSFRSWHPCRAGSPWSTRGPSGSTGSRAPRT